MTEHDQHIVDDLPQLLTGEADRGRTIAAAAHLRECEDCRQELVSAVVAHASLTSAQRFAPDVVSRPPEGAHAGSTAPKPLPDLSAMFAEIRAEAAAESEDAEPPRASSRRWLLVAAAVVAGALVGGGAVALTHTGSGASNGSRSIALAAYGVGTSPARATVSSSGTMAVDATSLPVLDSADRYEIWLTNGARTQMMPIGWIGDSGTAKVTVPASLMNSYSDIEVSVQKVDSPSYTYSGTSVLRGSY